jgi:hypothetical protein
MANKQESKIIHIQIECGYCGKKSNLPFEKIQDSFCHTSQECDCCGSHGEITFEPLCSYCKKMLEIEISSF